MGKVWGTYLTTLISLIIVDWHVYHRSVTSKLKLHWCWLSTCYFISLGNLSCHYAIMKVVGTFSVIDYAYECLCCSTCVKFYCIGVCSVLIYCLLWLIMCHRNKKSTTYASAKQSQNSASTQWCSETIDAECALVGDLCLLTAVMLHLHLTRCLFA